MGIKFIDGNIFSRLSASKPTYICQQVNCNSRNNSNKTFTEIR